MRNIIRLLLVNSNQESLNLINKLLEKYSDYKIIGEANDSVHALDMAIRYQPDIVLMDVNLPDLDGFKTTTKITQEIPYIGVILFGSTDYEDILRKAMQSGAGDFLDLPLDGTKLHNSISSLYTIKEEQKQQLLKNPLTIPHRHTRIISVFSAKGGVGKTLIATNIAIALKELTREDVVLIDLDLQFGDIANFMNIDPKLTIVDLLQNSNNIDQSELETYLFAHQSGIKVLCAPLQPEQADLLGSKEIQIIKSLVESNCDYMIFDLSPFFNEVVLEVLGISDNILMISTMDIPTLKTVRSSVEVLQKLNYPEKNITHILNRYNTKREIRLNDIYQFLNISEMICIDDNPELVGSSINSGEPLVASNPDSTIARQITELCKKMIDYRLPEKKSSLFQRILRKG